MNQDQFLLDSGFWGWLYKLLYPVEWLMTQIMAVFHKFLVMLGMNEIGFSWVMSIVFLVIVVQACVFPLFYKSMKGMRKMQAQMAVLQPKMQRIQNKYKGKNDPASKEALQREMMKLYQDNDANPMGGCTSMLPMFVQGPVFMCMFYTLSAIPYIARGKFRNGSGLGAFDIATAKQFTSTNVFGVNVADNFTTATVSGKIVIGIFVVSSFPRIATTQRMAPGNAGIIILIRQEAIVIRIIGNMAKHTIPFAHGRASFPANVFQPNVSILDEARGSLNVWMQTSRRNANPMQGTPPSKSSRCCGVTVTLGMA